MKLVLLELQEKKFYNFNAKIKSILNLLNYNRRNTYKIYCFYIQNLNIDLKNVTEWKEKQSLSQI